MVADSQSSSQVGDVARFRDMLLLTPTEREARLALHDSNSGLVVLAEAIRERSRAKNVILTLGAEGVLIHANVDAPGGWLTDQLPAFNPAPKDAAGAGDSFLTCTSLALLAGANIWQSAYLGSLAAACQVGRVGNLPLSVEEIEAQAAAPKSALSVPPQVAQNLLPSSYQNNATTAQSEPPAANGAQEAAQPTTQTSGQSAQAPVVGSGRGACLGHGSRLGA